MTWRNGPAKRGQELHCEVTHEGSFVGEEDLFEMQDCAPCRGGEGDLRKPEAQAAARMSSKIENRAVFAVNLIVSSLDFRVSICEVMNGTYCWC